MRRLLRPALAGVALMTLVTGARAADYSPVLVAPPVGVAMPDNGGWYLRGDIGVGATSARRWAYNPNPFWGITGGTYEHSTSSAFFFGAGIGYAFNSWLRADITAEYRVGARFRGRDELIAGPPNPPNVTGYQNNLRANMSSFVTMVNGYIDLGTWSSITPFIGAGVGVAYNMLGTTTDTGLQLFNNAAPSATAGTISGASRTNFAWALMAGVAWDLSAQMKVELGYRYMNLGSFQSGAPCPTTCGTAIRNYEIRQVTSHDIRLGLRYAFGAPPVAAAPIVARY